MLLFILPAIGLLAFLALPLASILLGAPLSEILAAFGDPELLRSLIVTFTAAILATWLGMLGGVPLAYLLARRNFPGKRLVEGWSICRWWCRTPPPASPC